MVPPGRSGSRRGTPAKRGVKRAEVAVALGAVAALLVWAALVWVAIGFGRSARGGDHTSWWWLSLTSVGAVLCLFGCLALLSALLRRRGVIAPSGPRRH